MAVIKHARYYGSPVEDEVMRRIGGLTRRDLKGVPPLGAGWEKVYVCSPYAAETAAGVEKNIRAAKRYALYCIGKRKQPVASHLIYTQLLEDNDELQREMGLSFGRNLLEECSSIWVFQKPGTALSAGMKSEIDFAKKHHIPVKFINDHKAYGYHPWNPYTTLTPDEGGDV